MAAQATSRYSTKNALYTLVLVLVLNVSELKMTGNGREAESEEDKVKASVASKVNREKRFIVTKKSKACL